MRIYTDESSTQPDQGSYMLIGGIICDVETSKEVRKAIKLLKSSHNLSNNFEFHFSRINSRQVEIYKKLCDIFSDFYHQKCPYKRGFKEAKVYRRLCFEVMLILHAKIDHSKFSDGDAELGFFRFYYALLSNAIQKHYDKERGFHITIDDITTKDPRRVPNLHKRLNQTLPGVEAPVKNVDPQNSKDELLLQMADVILGSVSFAWNKQPTDTSKNNDAKREVVKHLEDKLDIQLSKPTYSGKSFNIWELIMG